MRVTAYCEVFFSVACCTAASGNNPIIKICSWVAPFPFPQRNFLVHSALGFLLNYSALPSCFQEFNFAYYINSSELSLNRLAFNRGYCMFHMSFLSHCRLADAQLFHLFSYCLTILFFPSYVLLNEWSLCFGVLSF